MRGRRRALAAALAVAALSAALGAPAALARVAYLSTEDLNSVSAVDLSAGKEIGSPIAVGTTPYGVAISPDGTHAYVANGKSSTVSVIDTATNSVVGKPIPIGSNANPVTLVVSPDGRHVYVHCTKVSKVFVIDTTTGAVVQEIPVEARGIALSPDGKSLFVAELPGQVGVFDTATGKPTGQVLDAETDPQELAVSPDGATLYALHFGSPGTVTKVDLASGAHTPIGVGEYPVSMALTPNGKRLFVGRQTSPTGHVTVVETATDATVGGPIPIEGGLVAMAMAPAGNFAYTGVGSTTKGAVASIDTSSFAVGTAAKVFGYHQGLAIVPNQGPVASLGVTVSGTTASFDAAASSDPDGHVVSYSWDFGDGTTANGPAASVSHTYAPGATYTARVTPLDNEGCAATRVFTGQATLCNPSATPSATVSIDTRVASPAPAPASGGAGTPKPTGRARAAIHLGRLILDQSKGAATLSVRVSAAGKLKLGGQVTPRTLRAKRAGKLTLQLVPRGRLKRELADEGHATAKVALTFTAPGLLPARASRSVGLIERSGGPGA